MEQNNQNINTNEEVNSNFITFFTKHKIEIPLIQRDYVQGSNLQSKKRNEFIDSLFEALKDDGNRKQWCIPSIGRSTKTHNTIPFTLVSDK